jgi:DNA-binding response OmpR family regulator
MHACREPGFQLVAFSLDCSDVRMPGKNGIELLGLIRADERLERVPVILLTAKAMTQDRIAGYKAGADVYLSKPFDPDELLSILDNAIQRRRQMTGRNGNLLDLKQEMEDIKQIMRKVRLIPARKNGT